MKKLILSAIFIGSLLFSVSAQIAPPGSSDKNLEDRNIKNRSVELDRIKREADKPEKEKQPVEPSPQLNFAEIKEDFEKIQILQTAIIEAYTKDKQIDYLKISEKASEMSNSGTRLKGNLFAQVKAESSDSKDAKKTKDKLRESEKAVVWDEKNEAEKPLPSDVKNLIVELDNAIMIFTANPMFRNPQTSKAADNLKAKTDLERIIRLSTALKNEADKSAKP